MEQLKPKGGEGNGFEKWKEMLDGVSDAGRKKIGREVTKNGKEGR